MSSDSLARVASQSRMKPLLFHGTAIVLSLVLGTLLVEVGGRLVLNPADYLSAATIPDPVLGIVIEPGAAGFDEWGFRNRVVPAATDVLALGDSHTFGNTAKMAEAWPSVVSRETGLNVYNMGLGGYGPNQYSHLLMARGLTLRPKTVIVGLYMGDDFENAYSITYGLDYWAALRQGTHAPVDADIWGDWEPPGPFKRLRNWLSRTSMLYRITVHGPALATLKASLQFGQVSGGEDPSVAVLEDRTDNIHEAFRPIRIAAGLDQQRPEVREGMRITFHLLEGMRKACEENHCSLAVVIIPSKETVFAEYFSRHQDVALLQTIESLIANERLARAEVVRFLEGAAIPYVDALPALRKAVRDELYYRGPADMHPNANGYRVIGEAVAGFLKESVDARSSR